LHVAERFERFLDTYRRPDGGRWGGAELAKATGGAVPRSYVTNLRKGRKGSPGYEKMRAVAKAMGFPPEAWFEGAPGPGGAGHPCGGAGRRREGRASLRGGQAPEDRGALQERRRSPHERGRPDGGGGRGDKERLDS
jgi:transcriptional regulator with XRE-family HTH domain